MLLPSVAVEASVPTGEPAGTTPLTARFRPALISSASLCVVPVELMLPLSMLSRPEAMVMPDAEIEVVPKAAQGTVLGVEPRELVNTVCFAVVVCVSHRVISW